MSVCACSISYLYKSNDFSCFFNPDYPTEKIINSLIAQSNSISITLKDIRSNGIARYECSLRKSVKVGIILNSLSFFIAIEDIYQYTS